jgi:hypothetical protein
MQPTPTLPMPIDSWRRYDLVTKSYQGWYAGRKLTRKLYAEISGVSVQCLKFHDHHPGAKMKPHIIRKLAALQIEVRADRQLSCIDNRAELAAAKLAAKAEADKQRALDRLLDAAMRAGRKPLSRKSKQASIF